MLYLKKCSTAGTIVCNNCVLQTVQVHHTRVKCQLVGAAWSANNASNYKTKNQCLIISTQGQCPTLDIC